MLPVKNFLRKDDTMYFLIKWDRKATHKKNKWQLLDFSEDKNYLVHSLQKKLKKDKAYYTDFTFRAVKILEKPLFKNYRNCVKTNKEEEYFIMDFNSISLAEYC